MRAKESEFNSLKTEKKDWTKCVRVNQNTVQNLHSKIIIINKLTDELHYERQRNRNLVIESDQCQTDLVQCQAAYNSTDRLDYERCRQEQTLTINERDNQIIRLRQQLVACDQRDGNCDDRVTFLQDQLSKSKNAHQLAEQQLTKFKNTIEALDNELADCKNQTIELGKQLTDNTHSL